MIHVGVASWIIQDGNYADFEVGKDYRFALEFYPNEVAEANTSERLLRHRSGGIHEVAGRIIFSSQRVWVIDCGVLAYKEAQPPNFAEVGSWFKGRIYLGIDPFFYFEYLCREKGMPDLFRRYRITGIHLETTPWEETKNFLGQRVIKRVEGIDTFRPVNQTDAWNDDGGNAHYVLDCEQLDT